MSDTTPMELGYDDGVLAMATEIVAAYASRNQMSQGELPDLIHSVYGTLNTLAGGTNEAQTETPPEARPTPAVPIDASVTPDALICLEDGKPFKTLKRHLRTAYDMSPDEYRERWGLSKDYPMVAPNYSKRRSDTAKKIGLGRKPGTKMKKK